MSFLFRDGFPSPKQSILILLKRLPYFSVRSLFLHYLLVGNTIVENQHIHRNPTKKNLDQKIIFLLQRSVECINIVETKLIKFLWNGVEVLLKIKEELNVSNQGTISISYHNNNSKDFSFVREQCEIDCKKNFYPLNK